PGHPPRTRSPHTPVHAPTPSAAPSGGRHSRLNLKLDNTHSRLRVGDLTNTWLDVFPDVPWSQDALSRGVMFTKDSLNSPKPEDREDIIHRLRLVLMRALRYEAKRAAHLAEIARRDAA